jgi:gamma-glutamylcyclotransferase (GGCT)/AIG2-like uncharacterized protein YtfP
MPLIFSYGTLQEEDVQMSTFGRRLQGQQDEIVGYEPCRVRIEDREEAARLGMTHYANLKYNGREDSRLPGMTFEISDAELAKVDRYEAAALYRRIAVRLASGRQAWVYLHDEAPVSP